MSDDSAAGGDVNASPRLNRFLFAPECSDGLRDSICQEQPALCGDGLCDSICQAWAPKNTTSPYAHACRRCEKERMDRDGWIDFTQS